MNERIRALAEQAGYQEDLFGLGHWDMPECQRLVELIVRECAGLCSIAAPGRDAEDIEEAILKHFGVKQ
jgi:hypothetical protein